VSESIEQERRTRRPIREVVLRRLGAGTDRYAPDSAGLYRMSVDEMVEMHSALLFNGAVVLGPEALAQLCRALPLIGERCDDGEQHDDDDDQNPGHVDSS